MMKRLFDRRKLFSTVLNIAGMAVALGTFTAINIQVRYDWGYDNYPGADCIWRMELSEDEGNKVYSAHMSRPVIENIKDADPQVLAVTAFQSSGMHKERFTLAKGDGNARSYRLAITDGSVAEVFPFEFVQGSPSGYSAENDCIISRSAAQELFGNENPVGRTIWQDGSEMRIAAVFKDFPANSTIPDILVNMGDRQIGDYSEWNMMCYMRLREGTSGEQVRKSLFGKTAYLYDLDLSSLDGEELSQMQESLRLTRIHDIYFDRMMEDNLPKGNRTTTNTLFAVSLLIVLIAVINFINFSMASVPFGMKSINTRKVLGSSRSALVARQLLGSLATTLAAYVLSLVLLEALSSSSLASYISGSLRPSDNIPVLLAGLGVSVAAAFLSGIYPALYSTSFQPAIVLKGSFSLSAGGRSLRNVMTGFQYVISFVLASAALYIIVQTNYMKGYDMGFVSDQVVVASPAGDQTAFRQKMAANPDIKGVTFAGGQLVSNGKMGWGRTYDGQRIQLDVLPVSADFLDFFSLKITDGRGFVPSDELSASGTFILNETAMAKYPMLRIGARMSGHDSQNPAEIAGVVKDFNFQPMQYAIKPLALYNFGSNPWWDLSYAYVRISPRNVGETLQYIRDAVASLNPGIQPDYITVEFLDENIGSMYGKEERLSNIIVAAALLSFVIALVGVLGLVYFETQFRRREIAVKKVYGASVKDILVMFNRKYALLTLWSFIVSLPLSYAVIRMWVRDFPYQAPVPVWIFAATLAAMLAVTALTVTLRSYGAATDNPVEAIKNE